MGSRIAIFRCSDLFTFLRNPIFTENCAEQGIICSQWCELIHRCSHNSFSNSVAMVTVRTISNWFGLDSFSSSQATSFLPSFHILSASLDPHRGKKCLHFPRRLSPNFFPFVFCCEPNFSPIFLLRNFRSSRIIEPTYCITSIEFIFIRNAVAQQPYRSCRPYIYQKSHTLPTTNLAILHSFRKHDQYVLRPCLRPCLLTNLYKGHLGLFPLLSRHDGGSSISFITLSFYTIRLVASPIVQC